MGAKLLKDSGHEDDHIVSIFRFFRASITKWTKEMAERTADSEHARDMGRPHSSPCDTWSMLALAIMDNRRAMLIGVSSDRRLFEFREGVETTNAPVPILQVSVTLSSLLELVVLPAQPARPARAKAGAPEAGSPDHPAVP